MSLPDPDSAGAATTGPRWAAALRRFGPLLALLAFALFAEQAGLLRQFSPHALSRHEAELQVLARSTPILALGLYVLTYGFATGACLPVAMVLTMSSGVVFGAWLGGAATVVGACIGAILTYGAARAAFAPSLISRARRDQRLQRIVEGFGRNAFSYVLTLRLIPFFPFPLVNVGAGLAATPLRAYALATVIGVWPSSLIYASLGAGLGSSMQSPHVLRAALHAPGVIVPLAMLTLLSVVPVGVQTIRARARG